MFSPRWKKESRLLYKGAKKFLNYKRDLLTEEKVANIGETRAKLLEAIKAGDRDKVKEAEKLVAKACENALPRYRRPNALEENIEVFFVAIVIALGIRAYFLQPFRIPTGSMRPTLNGIIGHKLAKEKFPAFPVKAWQAVAGGRKYIYKRLSSEEERYILPHPTSRLRHPIVSSSDVLTITKGDPKIGPMTAIPVAIPRLRWNHRAMITGQVTAWLIPDAPIEMITIAT